MDNIILPIGKAHQRKIREQKELEGEIPIHINRDISNAIIKPIDRKLATQDSGRI